MFLRSASCSSKLRKEAVGTFSVGQMHRWQPGLAFSIMNCNHQNLQSLASWSQAQEITEVGQQGADGGTPVGLNPDSETWSYLWVCSVWIELNHRTPPGVLRIAYWYGKEPHPYTHIHALELSPGTLKYMAKTGGGEGALEKIYETLIYLTPCFCCSVTQSCSTLCGPMDYSMPGLPLLQHLPKYAQLMSTESMTPSNHLILCHPLLLLSSIFPSIRVFSSESVLRIRWPKDWSFSWGISPSNEYSGLISFRIDWFGLLAVQGTLKSLLQHQSWKALILHSAFFMVQISHLYMTTGKP